MNKIAEIMYGKVANIYETTRTLEEMRALFVPAALLVDVTDVEDIGIGYRADFGSGLDTPNFIGPKKIIPQTLEEAKYYKIAELKAERDSREVQVIEYNKNTFDYDDKARERMRIAKDALIYTETESQAWTCADNTITELTVTDFDNINALAAQRSGELHLQYNKLKVLVNACEEVDDVYAINFDTDTSSVGGNTDSESTSTEETVEKE